MARDDANKVRRIPHHWYDFMMDLPDNEVHERVDPKDVPAYSKDTDQL